MPHPDLTAKAAALEAAIASAQAAMDAYRAECGQEERKTTHG